MSPISLSIHYWSKKDLFGPWLPCQTSFSSHYQQATWSRPSVLFIFVPSEVKYLSIFPKSLLSLSGFSSLHLERFLLGDRFPCTRILYGLVHVPWAQWLMHCASSFPQNRVLVIKLCTFKVKGYHQHFLKESSSEHYKGCLKGGINKSGSVIHVLVEMLM